MLTDEDKKWIKELLRHEEANFPIAKMQELKESVFVALEDSLKRYVNFQLDSKLIMELLGIKREGFFNQDYNEELQQKIVNILGEKIPPALQEYIDRRLSELQGAIDRYIRGLIKDWTEDKLIPVVKKKLAETIDKTSFDITVSASDIDKDWDD